MNMYNEIRHTAKFPLLFTVRHNKMFYNARQRSKHALTSLSSKGVLNQPPGTLLYETTEQYLSAILHCLHIHDWSTEYRLYKHCTILSNYCT